MTALKYILQKLKVHQEDHKFLFLEHIQDYFVDCLNLKFLKSMKELLKLKQLHVKRETVRKFQSLQTNAEVDPIGSCVGARGARVQSISTELNGEKIDIVEWSEDPVVFVANALSPSKVLDVQVNEEERSTTVVVPDYQLSLAIGKRGQNARLAAKLTGWKIDIKSEDRCTRTWNLSARVIK